jgi:hypothetical protein
MTPAICLISGMEMLTLNAAMNMSSDLEQIAPNPKNNFILLQTLVAKGHLRLYTLFPYFGLKGFIIVRFRMKVMLVLLRLIKIATEVTL